MNVCADAHMPCGRLIPLLADGIRPRKDAFVDRSGFSNKPGSLPLGLWNKSNNLAHVSLLLYYNYHSIQPCRSLDADFEAPQVVTKE